MVEEAGHLDGHVAVAQRDQGRFEGEGAATGRLHLFAHPAGAPAIDGGPALAQQHQAGGHRVRGVHQRREAQPVVRPALHVLVVGAAHELDPPQLPLFVQVLHIEEFPAVHGGLHEHVVLAALLAGLDDLIQLVQAQAHGNGAGAVLAGVQCLDGQGGVGGRGRHQVHRVDGLVRQHRIKVRQTLFQQELVGDLVQLLPVGVHQHQGVHIRVL